MYLHVKHPCEPWWTLRLDSLACRYYQRALRKSEPPDSHVVISGIRIDNKLDINPFLLLTTTTAKAAATTTTTSSSSMASSTHSRTSPAPPSSFRSTQIPVSRRTASSYDVRPYETGALQQHHRSSSSSALSYNRSSISGAPNTQPATTVSDPRFSRLFSTVLGSPFLTTSEPLPQQLELVNIDSERYVRPSSPAPTADFSIIEMDIDEAQVIPGSYPSRFPSTSMANLNFSRSRPIYENAWPSHDSTHQPSASFKSLIPRIWEAISSPSRAILGPNPPLPSRTPSPSASPRRHANQSWYTNNGSLSGRNSPVYWHTGKGKGKSKVGGLFSTRNGSRGELKNINYSELPPLDGEEGELIDDEACFIDSRAVRGIGTCSSVSMAVINT